MNNQENQIFYALLRKALFDQTPDTAAWTGSWKWAPIVRAIEDHRLQSLMVEPLLSLPVGLQPSADVTGRFTQIMAMNMQKHSQLNADINTVYGLLEANGFHPILMKGQANATLYPKPLLRMTGDVDTYIGTGNKAATDLIMNQLPGCKLLEGSEKHTQVIYGKTEFEIHLYAEKLEYPQHDGPYQQLVDEYFSHPDTITVGNGQVQTVPQQFLPLYLFNHLWHHMRGGGVGLRQFCDLAMALHRVHGKIDLARLQSDLKAVGLWREWQIAGGMVVNLLGLPQDEFPFYKEIGMKKVWAFSEMVITDGNFGRNRFDKIGSWTFAQHFKNALSIHWTRAYQLSKVSFPLASVHFLVKAKDGVSNILHGRW